MILRNIKQIIPALAFLLCMGVTSCADELNIGSINPQDTTDFNQNDVFAKIYATLALTGQVGPDGNGDVAGIDEGTSAFYRLIFTMNEYPTDEVICAWGDTGIPELNFMSWGSSNGQIEGLYGRLNFDVTLVNHFLEQTEGLADDVTIRQRAEARFIRALNLYHLMDLFGNPPFSEVVSEESPQQIQRADLFVYIENELLEIVDDMYEPRQAPFGRADKACAWFLLSRLYLNAEVYTGTAHWSDAATYSKLVLDSSYELSPVYKHLFMGDNDKNDDAMQEIILPIRQDGVNTRSWGGSLYVIAATHTDGMNSWGTDQGWGGVRARQALVSKFFNNLSSVPMDGDENAMVAAANDDRAMFFSNGDRTIEINTVSTFKEGLSIAKWTNSYSDGSSPRDVTYTDTDIPYFRLGEAYLNYAEAMFRTGDTSTARTYINLLRDRANASSLSSVTLQTILDERARELYCEGIRRTDLIRFGYFTTNAYTWDWKGGTKNGTSVSSIYNLYPIPASDINANENLIQNTGY